MEEKIKALLDREKIDKPVLSMRQVGNRIELHLLGDREAVVFDLEETASAPAARQNARSVYTSAELSKMTVPVLQEIAQTLGLRTSVRRKTDLIAHILEEQSHDNLA